MLLSGTDNHIAGLGVMNEQKGLDPERWDVPGHEGYLKSVLQALASLPSADHHQVITLQRCRNYCKTEAITP